jgi:F0F1-type ATP synthase assembly protein I
VAKTPRERAPWFRYTDAASVGIEMVVAITICALGALWLERNVTHWAPWTSLIGILVGVGAAAKAVLRAARTAAREAAADPAKTAPEAAATGRRPDSPASGDDRGNSG